MRLADFILSHLEPILAEWEVFAATQLPAARTMTPLALRDHARQILEAIATDVSTPQTPEAQAGKAQGRAPTRRGAPGPRLRGRAVSAWYPQASPPGWRYPGRRTATAVTTVATGRAVNPGWREVQGSHPFALAVLTQASRWVRAGAPAGLTRNRQALRPILTDEMAALG